MKKQNNENMHKCPVYGKVIDEDLCYETIMCMRKMFKTSSLKELDDVEDIEKARQQCQECAYSKL